jgi:hypothetical protein
MEVVILTVSIAVGLASAVMYGIVNYIWQLLK